MRYAVLRDMTWDEEEDEQWDTEEDAIDFALEYLPSDDFVYGIIDTEINDFTCIVFQQRTWRPE